MKSEYVNNLLQSSNALVKYRLGIPEFKESVTSYRKILYSNSILTYDSDSIYLLDKVHLTFCLAEKINSDIVDAYRTHSNFNVDEHLVLKSNYANGNNYHYSFAIEFDGVHFGLLHLSNTKRTNLCKIEIDNRIIYERTIMFIIARLFFITEMLSLTFHNISNIEIARDTPKQVYSSLSKIYYQSTKCNQIVHELSGMSPKFKPVTKTKIHDYPDDNGQNGTFTLGAKKSETIVKVYCKTPEIRDNDFKKDYIHEIHLKHFGCPQNINRVEVSISSNAFRRSGLLNEYNSDLIQVLLPINFPNTFFKVLGEKLTFNILSSKVWDEANNEKYEKITLLQRPCDSVIKQKRFMLQPTSIRFAHSNNVNTYKFKLTEYLDEDITFSELRRYFGLKRGKNELQVDALVKAYDIVIRNYKNSIQKKKQQRLYNFILSLNETDKGEGFLRRICQFFRKITL